MVRQVDADASLTENWCVASVANPGADVKNSPLSEDQLPDLVSADEQGSFELAQNLYEGMFLLDSGKYAASPDNTTNHVLEILQKAGATIVAHRPWADGKLAYPVKGHKKGLHLLTYFTMPSSGLTEVTRQVHLSENILRHMVLKHPKVLFDAMVNALSGKEGTFRHVENVDEAPRPARRGRDEEVVIEGVDALGEDDER